MNQFVLISYISAARWSALLNPSAWTCRDGAAIWGRICRSWIRRGCSWAGLSKISQCGYINTLRWLGRNTETKGRDLTTLQLAVAVDIFKPHILRTAWKGMSGISTKRKRASALRDKGHQLGGTRDISTKGQVLLLCEKHGMRNYTSCPDSWGAARPLKCGFEITAEGV